jgi:hypothetical protein
MDNNKEQPMTNLFQVSMEAGDLIGLTNPSNKNVNWKTVFINITSCHQSTATNGINFFSGKASSATFTSLCPIHHHPFPTLLDRTSIVTISPQILQITSE